MPRTLIIVNHVAAKARRAWPIVRAQLEASRIEFDFHETTAAGDATRRTRAALYSGYQTIVVLGGDGTLSEAAEGFFEFEKNFEVTPRPINSGAALAILPAGTGDDFARGSRGTRAPLEEWTKTLIAHLEGQAETRTRTVDLIYGRCDNYTRPYICLNASTLGIGGETGARVAAQGEFMRRFSGEARFLLAAAGAVSAWRERRVVVTVDGQLVDQGKILVHHVDAERARMVDGLEDDRLASQQDPAGVGLVEAAENLQQRGLAGAVVAEQAEHLAAAQMQVHVGERRHRAEALGDVLDPQDIIAGSRAGGLLFLHLSRHQVLPILRSRVR